MLELLSLGNEIPRARDFAQQSRQHAQGPGRRVRLRISQRDIHLVDLGLGEMIGSLTKHGMEEIHHTKGTSHKREDPTSMEVYLGVRARMRENIMESHLAQSEFTVIRVRAKVLQGMKTLAQRTEGLGKIFLAALTLSTIGIHSPVVDAARQTVSDVGSASVPIAAFVGDVVLHSSVGVDFEFDLAHGGSESLVVLAGILVIGIVFGVAG